MRRHPAAVLASAAALAVLTTACGAPTAEKTEQAAASAGSKIAAAPSRTHPQGSAENRVPPAPITTA